MPSKREGPKDLRVSKTLRLIKQAFMKIILTTPFDNITIVSIVREAEINRKTFYLHYSSIEELLMDIEDDFVAGIEEKLDALDPDDLSGALLVYYEFLDTDDRSVQKLLYDREYVRFFKKINDDILSLPFFAKFCQIDGYQKIVRGYFEAATGIYLRWRDESGEKMSLSELASVAADLIRSGLSHGSPNSTRR